MPSVPTLPLARSLPQPPRCPHGVFACQCVKILGWLQRDMYYLVSLIFVSWAARIHYHFQFPARVHSGIPSWSPVEVSRVVSR